MIFNSFIGLATIDVKVELTEFDALRCYGLCKMTVKQDMFGGSEGYLKLKPVEFYEYLGRVADKKWENEPNMPLQTKLEKLLDMILPPYKLQRVPTPTEIEVESEQESSSGEEYDVNSDDSVDYDNLDLNQILFKDPESTDLRLELELN